MKTDGNFRALLIIGLVVVIGVSYFANRTTKPSSEVAEPRLNKRIEADPKSKETSAQTKLPVTLTIDGYDAASKTIIQRINLWNNYETRARVVGQVSHGEKVTLIKRVGDGVFVETKAGLKGWLTYWFIKEMNNSKN